MTATTCRVTRKPLLVWLGRGGIGVALLILAASTRELFVVVPALLGALLAFGGCPMCWTLGLFERSSQLLRPVEEERTP